MNTSRCVALLGALWLCASSARAETCTVTGKYTYEPTDMYYCDSDRQSCGGWLQVDLDRMRGTSAAPVRYMRVLVRTTAGTTLATTHTDSTGAFSATFASTSLPNAPTLCRNQTVTIRADFLRLDERDAAASTKRYRFRIVDRNGTLQTHARNATFPSSGATLTSNFRQLASATDNPAHYYTTYHIMDSAIAQIIGWSTTLRDRMTSSVASEQQPVVMDINWDNLPTTEASTTHRGRIWMAWSWYNAGGVLRHELGHWVHQQIYDRNQVRGSCVDGRYPSYSPPPPPVGAVAHGVDTCEYGYTATLEGMATAIGVRSVTAADTNVWMCAYTGGSVDACSVDVAGRAGDGNGDGVTAGYQILGDDFADRASRCTVLEATSCGCGNGCSTQANKDALGFRVETQVARFVWDLLDTSTDSGGVDDVDYSMGGLITEMQKMACDKNTVGLDNTCNEATLSDGTCALDKHNMYDLAQLLPTDESQERTLNCVAQAKD